MNYAIIQLRMLVAENLIAAALFLMPKDEPTANIWLRHIGAAFKELAPTLKRERVDGGRI